jgi:hypothetical protein
MAVFIRLATLIVLGGTADAQLSPNFYARSCSNLATIKRGFIKRKKLKLLLRDNDKANHSIPPAGRVPLTLGDLSHATPGPIPQFSSPPSLLFFIAVIRSPIN